MAGSRPWPTAPGQPGWCSRRRGRKRHGTDGPVGTIGAGRAPGRRQLIDRLVNINRVAKVVKGGRRFGFSALVIVGDGKGRVGYGSGKAREVPEAVRKATEQAKRSLVRVPLRQGRTLHHDIEGHFGAGRVVRAAPRAPGSLPAGRCGRCSRRSASKTWSPSRFAPPTRTTWSRQPSTALAEMMSPRAVAAKRGKKVGDIVGRRDAGGEARAGRRDGDQADPGDPDRQPDRPSAPAGQSGRPRAEQDPALPNPARHARVRGRISQVHHLVRVDPVDEPAGATQQAAGDARDQRKQTDEA